LEIKTEKTHDDENIWKKIKEILIQVSKFFYI
jgi:hypothetical protein